MTQDRNEHRDEQMRLDEASFSRGHSSLTSILMGHIMISIKVYIMNYLMNRREPGAISCHLLPKN